MSESIAAVATAPGVGGVAIIRISGDDALAIAEKVFIPAGKVSVRDFKPYMLYIGDILGDGFKDNGMCVYFKAPKSFTGEDVIELHCHGGIAITRGILENVFKNGARPATNGEYTKRAFLNGKLSLSSAEGLIDMINSESVTQIKSAFYLFREQLKNKIVDIQSSLTSILAQIDANIDYPEEDLIEENGAEIKEKLLNLRNPLEGLVNSYSYGQLISDGIKVALVGKTNTGKSSLLNILTGEDKAIVTDVEGTTRDVVEGKLFVNGIKFILYDTAGIRQTDDLVEQIGITKAKRFIEIADVIIFVTDKFTYDDEELELLNLLSDKKVIKVCNKSDIAPIDCNCNMLQISCKTGSNIDLLKEKLYELGAGNINTDGEFITQKRHFYALTGALNSLNTAINAIGVLPLDLIASDIKQCWNSLGEVTGTCASEDIINEIFARFCVGK